MAMERLPPPGPAPEGTITRAGEVSFYHTELGAGPATIFLHGGGPGSTGWSDFGQVAPMFAATRRCLLLDLLQYGRSEKCRVSGPMWDFHAGALVALMDALGIERADFLCNSWGGSIGLCLAARRPERVGAVVVTGSMPVLSGPLAPLPGGGRRGREARDWYYGGEGPTRAKLRRLIGGLEWYDAGRLPEWTVDMRYRQSLDEGERALAGLSDEPRGQRQDLTAELGAIGAPVLFLWGMHDAFLGPDYALMLARMVGQGNLHVMDRAGHHLQEERPVAYHRVVDAFLGSVAAVALDR
jgi:pimeloyl-ACP methyl ester carboxylesterase